MKPKSVKGVLFEGNGCWYLGFPLSFPLFLVLLYRSIKVLAVDDRSVLSVKFDARRGTMNQVGDGGGEPGAASDSNSGLVFFSRISPLFFFPLIDFLEIVFLPVY